MERVRRTYQLPKPAPQTLVTERLAAAAPPEKADNTGMGQPEPETLSVPPSPGPTPSVISDPSVRRSARTTKGTLSSTKYIDEVYLTSVHLGRDHQELQLAYLAELQTYFNTGIINVTDPRAYATKSFLIDPDTPSFQEAMNSEDLDHYVAAMQKKIKQLVQQST